MAYSFDDFIRDVDKNLLALVNKTSDDFSFYEFEADFYSNFPASFAAQQAILSCYNNNLKARLKPLDHFNREFVRQS